MSLFDAVRSGILNEVLDLLEDGANPNEGDAMGRTPLFDAAAAGRNNMVVGMLLYGADPSKKSNAGKTARDSTTCETTQTLLDLWRGYPVDDCKKRSAISTLNDFLQKHAAIELPKIQPATPEQVKDDRGKNISVTWAVRSGNLKEVKRLLKERADPNELDALGEPPIFSAFRNGDAALPALLLMHAADPSKKSQNRKTARDFANSTSTQALLDVFQDKQVTDASRQALVSALSNAPSDIQDDVRKRLGSAIVAEPYEIRADKAPNAASSDPLLATIDKDDSCEKNPDTIEDEVVDIDDDDPLMFAVRNGMLETVLRLLREGEADPNACDLLGETPLFEAVSSSNFNITTALLYHSADPEYRSVSGSTPRDFSSCEHMRLLLHLFICFRRRDVQALPDYDAVKALGDRIGNDEMRALAMRQLQNCQALNLSATIERRCTQGSIVGLPSCDFSGSSLPHPSSK